MRVKHFKSPEEIFNNYSDGVINGNILEFKKYIKDIYATLFQAIKYLSSMRIKGQSIPANILLVSLVENLVYIFKSENFLSEIETVYVGAASKNNSSFKSEIQPEKLDLSANLDKEKLIEYLKSENWCKINIDENCIVAWAERYYKEFYEKNNSHATKQDFIGDYFGKVKILGEIRNPHLFKNLIYPYTKKSNIKFEYLMDRLNDKLHKKNLGAFYTPPLYAKKALELVRAAIKNVSEGNDYIILDRCAGTGNLEKFMTDEELSHCVLSTYEYYEYKVLLEVLGTKVRHLIPPSEGDDTFRHGFVNGNNALSEEYIKNDIIQKYINNPKCNIIILENPPYAETTSIDQQNNKTSKKSSEWKGNYVVQEFKKYIKENNLHGTVSNELANSFIWSAFEYYLKKPNDSLILFAPIKYWKYQNLVNYKFNGGFGFNRKHFNASPDFISCIWWSNTKQTLENIQLKSYDIVKIKDKNSQSSKEELEFKGDINIHKIHKSYSDTIYDKRDISQSSPGVCCGINGYEKDPLSKQISVKQENMHDNNDIIGYLKAHKFGYQNATLSSILVRQITYDGHGFYIFKNNFLEKLLAFSGSVYGRYNNIWNDGCTKGKSGDGYKRLVDHIKKGKLNKFLLKNLFFTSLSDMSRMLSFVGSNGKLYKNELCLDDANGGTLALEKLKNFELNELEKEIWDLWNKILIESRTTKKYNSKYNYGVYQINKELNTFITDENKIKIYDYKSLNYNLEYLKKLIKKYYLEEILPTLIEYELVK